MGEAEKKALAETAELLVLEKTSGTGLGRGAQRRGRRGVRGQREVTLSLVDEAQRAGVRLEAACTRLGVSPRTVQRWRKPEPAEDRRCGPRTQPANHLSQAERVLQVATARAVPGHVPQADWAVPGRREAVHRQ